MSDRMVYNSSKKKAGSMIFKIEPEHNHGDRGDVSIFLASSEFSQYKSLWRFKMSRFRGCCESVWPRVRGVDLSWDGIPCVLFLLTHDGIQRLKSTILADLYFFRPISKSKTKYLKEIRWPHLSNAFTLHYMILCILVIHSATLKRGLTAI